MAEFDVVVCCPHLKFDVKNMVDTFKPDKPIYILPPKMYGQMNVKELTLDVLDIIDLYKKTKTNPVSFPGEENIYRVTRNIAYRNSKVVQ